MPCCLRLLPAVVLVLSLGACGGGGGEVAAAAPTPPAAGPSAGSPAAHDPAAGEPEAAQRRQAASGTAAGTANACADVRPFYWEIGDGAGAWASGSIGRTGAGRAIAADTDMRFASATKWLYAAFVAERRGGEVPDWEARMLSLRSGYTHFAGCRAGQTVDGCLAEADNDRFEADAEGRFYYGGAHMQKHASLIGLGAMDAPALAVAMRAALGTDVAIGMAQARPAGGATGTPADYARFLRRLLTNELALGRLLGSAAVCASTGRCPDGETLYSPAPAQESWHYSLGHWIEDGGLPGDAAFSSAGAFGFYPWVAADRSHYGIVAREVANADGDDDATGAGVASARCGRLIRRAWHTGVAQ